MIFFLALAVNRVHITTMTTTELAGKAIAIVLLLGVIPWITNVISPLGSWLARRL